MFICMYTNDYLCKCGMNLVSKNNTQLDHQLPFVDPSKETYTVHINTKTLLH